MGLFSRNSKDSRQTRGQTRSTKAKEPLDAIWKMLRTIASRTTANEEALSTLRRDFNRWERRNYRQREIDEVAPLSPLPSSSPVPKCVNEGYLCETCDPYKLMACHGNKSWTLK